jgi:hypothetical protein
MKQIYHDDRQYIAEKLLFVDQHTEQVSLLAYHKINSLKLSSKNSAYCISRNELMEIVQNSLLNFVSPDDVLWEEGFYVTELDN